MTETVNVASRGRYSTAVRSRVAAFTSPTSRIVGVDVARGLAVLGMFAAHVGVTEAFDWSAPTTWLDVVNGRSSILFALIAGVSIAILAGGSQAHERLHGDALVKARLRIFVRAAIIFVIGGLLEYLGTGIAIILPTYAVLFVLAIPFLRWRARSLFLAAALIGILMPLVIFAPEESFGPDDYYLGGGMIVDLFITGTYPALIWIAFVLAGLAIGRLDVRSLRTQLRLLIVGAALAVLAYSAAAVGGAIVGEPAGEASFGWSSGSSYIPEEGIEIERGEDVDLSGYSCEGGPSSYFCYTDDYYENAEGKEAIPSPKPDDISSPSFFYDYSSLVTSAAHSGSPFEVLGSGGFAMAALALCLLITRTRVARFILLPLASVGAIALSNYVAHVVTVFALGEFAWEKSDNGLLLAMAIAALVVSTLWALLIGKGPLEQLVSRVSLASAQSTPAPAGRLDAENPHKENTNT